MSDNSFNPRVALTQLRDIAMSFYRREIESADSTSTEYRRQRELVQSLHFEFKAAIRSKRRTHEQLRGFILSWLDAQSVESIPVWRSIVLTKVARVVGVTR